ncbi:hypothetical protein ACFX19_024122 [Malus domestica]
MGTEVQSKMYFPGYCFIQNLSTALQQIRSSSGGKFGLQDFNRPCGSSENEARISCDPPAKLFTSDQNKTEKRIKRTLFGIEISESDISSSAMTSQSDAAISESSPNWTIPPSSLSKNLTSIQACHPSTNLAHQRNHSSLGHVDVKPTIDVNDVPPNKYLHGVACEQNIVSLNELRNQESREGRLHWLEAVTLCNGKSSKEIESTRTCREQSKADGLVLDKGFSNENSGPRHQIDLNRCLTEEETETTAASSVMRTETVTDLEAPVIVETNIYGEDSTERRPEALVAISSSQAPQMQENAPCRNLEASENDSLLWFDICGPFPVKTICGNKYFVNFIDDFSRLGYTFLISEKSDALKYTESGQQKRPFALYLEQNGIVAQYITPGTPQQNAVSDRRNRTLIGMSCYFIGYPEKSKGYRFYIPQGHTRIQETHNAAFLEDEDVSDLSRENFVFE